MTESEFLRQQQAAVERMREMNARSQIPNKNTRHKMPPIPSFVSMPENSTQKTRSDTAPPVFEKANPQENKVQLNQPFAKNTGLNIPFLDNILKDGDSTLILGLLLILMSENTDKTLLFALVYILL